MYNAVRTLFKTIDSLVLNKLIINDISINTENIIVRTDKLFMRIDYQSTHQDQYTNTIEFSDYRYTKIPKIPFTEFSESDYFNTLVAIDIPLSYDEILKIIGSIILFIGMSDRNVRLLISRENPNRSKK